MIRTFSNWRKKTATVKSKTTTVNAAGVPQETEVVVAADVKINYWTTKSVETNVNDKFVNQATGKALLPPNMNIDTTMWMEVDGEKHYITGVDDVGGFGEVLSVSWSRSYGD